MKVTCEYCDSFVEADENGNCPSCGASLGISLKEHAEEQKRELEEQNAKQEAKEAALRKEQQQKQILNTVKDIATSPTGTAIASGLIHGLFSDLLGDSRPPQNHRRKRH